MAINIPYLPRNNNRFQKGSDAIEHYFLYHEEPFSQQQFLEPSVWKTFKWSKDFLTVSFVKLKGSMNIRVSLCYKQQQ